MGDSFSEFCTASNDVIYIYFKCLQQCRHLKLLKISFIPKIVHYDTLPNFLFWPPKLSSWPSCWCDYVTSYLHWWRKESHKVMTSMSFRCSCSFFHWTSLTVEVFADTHSITCDQSSNKNIVLKELSYIDSVKSCNKTVHFITNICRSDTCESQEWMKIEK